MAEGLPGSSPARHWASSDWATSASAWPPRRALPFGPNTIYYDPVRPTPEEEKEVGVTYCDTMDEVLRRAAS